MECDDPVVDEASIEQYIRGYAGRSKLRPTVANAVEKLRILIGLVTEADSRPECDFMVGEELLHDFALREASVIEEQLVYARENDPTVCNLLRYLATFTVEHMEHRNDDRNQRLRAEYKRNGLHGMFKVRTVEDIADDDLCLLCCDAAPSANYSSHCAHDPIGCAECLAKLDKCPVCLKQ